MNPAVREWLDDSRAKLRDGDLSESDFTRLETLLAEPRQMILYLYSKSTNPCSPIASWALYDPCEPNREDQLVASDTFPIPPKLPSKETPYRSVMDAINDGWRVVQFPREELHPFSDVDNSYLGFGFILERWTSGQAAVET
jgi:hypothetical protein